MDNVADYIAQNLVDHGVTHVFGYPGASILPLLQAVVKHPGLEWVLMRNEAAASLAASAQAKLTGKLAACLATSGPGATNMITGLIDAHADGAPVLALTGMLPTWRQGRLEFQDVDTAGMLAPLFSRSAHCSHPNELPPMLREAMAVAVEQRCVTHLAIPTDIQALPLDEERAPMFHPVAPPPPTPLFPTDAAFDAAIKAIVEARHVTIAVGSGARGCGEAILRLAERLQAPVVTSLGGKGIVDERHPNVAGVLGIFGAPGEQVARDVLGHASLILSFGIANLGPFVAGRSGRQARELIRCAPSPRHVPGGFRARATLIGALSEIADGLSRRFTATPDGACLELSTASMKAFLAEWVEDRLPASGSHAHPVKVMRALSAQLPREAVVAFDIGDNAVWAAQFLHLSGDHAALVSENLGVMGFCLPALIAAAATYPDTVVMGIAGDGGVQMTIGELGAAAQAGLSLVLVILNNGILGRIRAQENEPYSVELKNPDFVALARSYGCDGLVVDAATDLEAAVARAYAHRGSPFVLDVRCAAEDLAPMSGWDDGFAPLHFA